MIINGNIINICVIDKIFDLLTNVHLTIVIPLDLVVDYNNPAGRRVVFLQRFCNGISSIADP